MKCHINLSISWFLGWYFFEVISHILGCFPRGGTTTPPRSALCIVKNYEYIIDFMRIDVYIEHISNFGGVF
jgi:hypothetical protein